MPTDPPTPAEKRRRAAAAALGGGAPITGVHATDLAAALLEIAEQVMPDSYLATDSRALLARAVISRAAADADLAAGGPLDDFAEDTVQRCRLAKNNHPDPGWGTYEKLAVALVLGDRAYLARSGLSAEDASALVAGSMDDPPADMRTWVERCRTALDEDPK